MPCSTYDILLKEWTAAEMEDMRALDPGTAGVQRMSAAKLLKLRADARRALKSADYRLNAHIDGCAVCQTDGREKFDCSQVHE
jgi:hypothetical protein